MSHRRANSIHSRVSTILEYKKSCPSESTQPQQPQSPTLVHTGFSVRGDKFLKLEEGKKKRKNHITLAGGKSVDK